MSALHVTKCVLGEVLQERADQEAKWGEQNLPDGTGGAAFSRRAIHLREECERAFAEGVGTWADIFEEEVAEALAEYDPERLREELVQVAAVAVAWVEAIDRRDVKRRHELADVWTCSRRGCLHRGACGYGAAG